MTDEFQWLESIDGDRALRWVDAQNERTRHDLASHPLFASLYADALAALSDDSRVPSVTLREGFVYNLWQDESHPRGLYRRMQLEDFVARSTSWQTVIDIDALSREEDTNWVFRGLTCLEGDSSFCLARLSRGGGDAFELREFNLQTLEFAVDGFRLPAGKHRVEWRDANHLYLAPDLGDAWRTTSGYPRYLVLLQRGQAVDDAPRLLETRAESVGLQISRLDSRAGPVHVAVDSTSFWTRRYYRLGEQGEVALIDLPDSAVIRGALDDNLLVQTWDTRSIAGSSFPVGSLVALGADGETTPIFTPADGRVLNGVATFDDGVVLTLLDNVRGRVEVVMPRADGFDRDVVPFPDNGDLEVEAVDRKRGDMLVRFEAFTTPPSLFFVPRGKDPVAVQRRSPTFEGDDFTVAQYWATSADGTRVPYFMVSHRDIVLDGRNPVHLFAYGGFRNPVLPSYSGTYEDLSGAYGKLWLERGGVYVTANIRGGGEFGPEWHSAALRENRPRAFEDFEAVARDLVARGVTEPGRIGIEGRSNGGLLVAATMIRFPELYGAVICGVPLADMRRYHELLAGASWMGEYGDPDNPDDWAFISKYSPYQLLDSEADYPPVFFFTSTRDDRVHPGHARKMMAKMRAQEHDAWYYENTEGGHGGSVTPQDLAYRLALSYVHLWTTLTTPPQGQTPVP